MRISDWSSDVCSSDLKIAVFERFFSEVREKDIAAVVGDDIEAALVNFRNGACRSRFGVGFRCIGSCGGEDHDDELLLFVFGLRRRGDRPSRSARIAGWRVCRAWSAARYEGGSVGKGCVGTCNI